MKKIILVSVLFGLMTTSANATYYETKTANCSDAQMMATLDSAVAKNRAVITRVTCEIPVVRPTVAPVSKHYQANKRFVKHTQRVYKHPKVCRRPTTIAIINVVDSEYCECGC